MEVNAMKCLKGFIYGLLFGSTSPIPGISAGTLAVLLNIYEKFFNSVSMANVKKNLPFLISFLFGWGYGLFWVSNVIMFLHDNYGQIMYFCFIGLILGCVPMTFVKVKADKVRPKNVLIFTFALSFMIFLAFSSDSITANSTLEQLGGMTLPVLARIFVLAFISAMTMLIPGIGGSLMMLVFGIYTVYVESISTLNPVIISVFVVSMILGVWAGIRLIKKMLELYSQSLYCAILGFIIGSVFIIYPGFSVDVEGVLSIIFAVLFAVLAYRLSKKRVD